MDNAQRLIVTLLTGIYRKLDIEDGIDPDLVDEAISSRNVWALPLKYPGVFDSEDLPPHVEHVFDVLDMWSIIEEAYGRLDKTQRERLKVAAAPFGTDVRWKGFDGNNESEYLSAAKMLIDHLDYYREFKGRGFNSHSPTRDPDRRMLEVFVPLKRGLADRGGLTVEDLAEVLKARAWSAA